MSFRTVILLALLACAILFYAVAGRQHPEPKPLPAKKKPVLAIPQKKNEAFELSEDFDWNQLTKEDIGDLTIHFRSAPGQSAEWEANIRLGQTFVTDVYEGSKPGQFIVSRVTPELTKGGNPKKPYTLKVSMQSFDFGGHSSKLAQYEMPMRLVKPGQLASSMVVASENGGHLLTITAEPNADGSTLTVRGKGGYVGNQPGTNLTE